MNAMTAMTEVLTINEMVEWAKSQNTKNEPNLQLCNITTLLCNYREVLLDLMEQTELGGGCHGHFGCKASDSGEYTE